MPVGDFYAPDPLMLCPLCGSAIPEWEGFGGPGAFVLFKQGASEPAEARLPSLVPDGGAHLEDGTIPLFATCREQHSLLAEAIVEDNVFVRAELRDVDGGAPLPITGDFVLWRSQGARFSVSTVVPTEGQGVVPASITAIGYNQGCILAVRRRDTRDPACVDEVFLVDIDKGEVLGPLSEPELKERLAERGLKSPDVMKLPEDVS